MKGAVSWTWAASSEGASRSYTCAYCNKHTGPSRGYAVSKFSHPYQQALYICTYCSRPTYFEGDEQYPGPSYGYEVEHLPSDVESLYNQCRAAMSVGSYSLAVLGCRKILMHIAVDKGAPAGLRFIDYITYLETNHFIPPDGNEWVDEIRTQGNDTNHEIIISAPEDAQLVIDFTEHLLRFVYAMPGKIRAKKQQTQSS